MAMSNTAKGLSIVGVAAVAIGLVGAGRIAHRQQMVREAPKMTDAAFYVLPDMTTAAKKIGDGTASDRDEDLILAGWNKYSSTATAEGVDLATQRSQWMRQFSPYLSAKGSREAFIKSWSRAMRRAKSTNKS